MYTSSSSGPSSNYICSSSRGGVLIDRCSLNLSGDVYYIRNYFYSSGSGAVEVTGANVETVTVTGSAALQNAMSSASKGSFIPPNKGSAQAPGSMDKNQSGSTKASKGKPQPSGSTAKTHSSSTKVSTLSSSQGKTSSSSSSTRVNNRPSSRSTARTPSKSTSGSSST